MVIIIITCDCCFYEYSRIFVNYSSTSQHVCLLMAHGWIHFSFLNTLLEKLGYINHKNNAVVFGICLFAHLTNEEFICSYILIYYMHMIHCSQNKSRTIFAVMHIMCDVWRQSEVAKLYFSYLFMRA